MLHWRPAVGMNNQLSNNGIAAEAESEMVSWILRQGFNPSDLRALDRSGRSLWHAAATGRLERCKHLLTRGLGDMISHKGYDGRSPLSKCASRRGRPGDVPIASALYIPTVSTNQLRAPHPTQATHVTPPSA